MDPSSNPTVYPTNNPSTTPTINFVPTQHPATDPTTFLHAVLITNDDYESTLMTTQLVTHNRMSTTESTIRLVAHTNDDVIQWIEALVREQMVLYVMIALSILLVVCNIIFCCCCRKKHKENVQSNTMVNIQMGKTHETHQIVPCDEDVECEMVASWMRYTVQLPQYVHLFISQGYSTMRAIKHIECKEDLAALGIQRG
eukprot:857369_1